MGGHCTHCRGLSGPCACDSGCDRPRGAQCRNQTSNISLRVNMINVWLVIDRSGSMGGSSWNSACAGVKSCLSQLTPSDVCSVVTFNNKVEVIASGSASKVSKDCLRSTTPSGETALYDAIVKAVGSACNEHEQLMTLQAATGAALGVLTYVVILTDGADTCSSAPLMLAKLQLAACNRYRGFKVVFGGINLRGAAREAMLELASVGDADIQYRELDGAKDIDELFEHVSVSIRERTASQRLMDALAKAAADAAQDCAREDEEEKKKQRERKERKQREEEAARKVHEEHRRRQEEQERKQREEEALRKKREDEAARKVQEEHRQRQEEQERKQRQAELELERIKSMLPSELQLKIFSAIDRRDVADLERLFRVNPRACDVVNKPRAGGDGFQLPLHEACGRSSLEVVRKLVDNGADLNQALQEEGFKTPLHIAIRSVARDASREQVALYLLRAGSNPAAQNASGQTALDYARALVLEDSNVKANLRAIINELSLVSPHSISPPSSSSPVARSVVPQSAAVFSQPRPGGSDPTAKLNVVSVPQLQADKTAPPDINMRPPPKSIVANTGIPEYAFEEITFRQQLGEGSYGQVFLATVRTQTVAVKKMKTNVRESYKRELENLNKARHKNIVSVTGFALETEPSGNVNHYCLIMEVAEHGSLYKVIGDDWSRQPPTIEQQIKVASGILGALSFMHASDIVHGDIKSSNVLMFEGYVPKLADFGLSRRISQSRGASSNASQLRYGTWCYASPDPSIRLTSEADVWACAIVLWELFMLDNTPWPDYQQPTTTAMMDNFIDLLKNDVRPKISAEWTAADAPQVKRNLAKLLLQMWKTAPGDRIKAAAAYTSLSQAAPR